MKISGLSLFWIFIFLSSCTSQEKGSNSETTATNSPKTDWLIAFNEGMNLDSLYIQEAVIVTENGKIYEDEASRTSYFKNLKEATANLQQDSLLFNTTTVNDIQYNIGTLLSSQESHYEYISIEESTGLRALDFYAKVNSNHQINLEEIDAARTEWMRLCNQHNAGELVEELYTKDAIYYNHKPVVVGTMSISKEYGYMNNREYRLKLEPLIVEPVNANIVFEVGQCSGSYGGKYVLVWQKDGEGDWKILLDSNV